MNFIVIFLIVFTFLSRIMGLGREMSLAYFYGASYVSDAYLMSIAIPTMMITFVIASLATSYIPAYQKLGDDVSEKHDFTNKVMGITLAICLLVLVIGLFFTPQIVPLFVTGFDKATIALTVSFTRITLFAVFFMGINHVLHSFMQVKEKVLLASLSGLPFNLFAIIFIMVSAYTSLYLLAIGTVVGLGAQCLYLLILAKRQGFSLRPRFDVKDSTIHKLILLTLPIMLANTVEQIGIMIDKNLASTFGAGAVSSLAYATRVNTAISGIVITSIIVVTFPKIAKQVVKGNMTKMKNSLAESIVGMSLFIIPIIAAVLMFAHPVISLLFERGSFDSDAVSVTARLFLFYIFFLLGNGISQLITRVFYALGDSKTPMIVAAITIMLDVILNFLLISFMGIAGLALATSVSAFIGMMILLFLLRRKVGSLRLRNTLISLNKIVGASVTCVFGAYFIYQYLLSIHAIFALLAATIVGMGIYGILLLILRIREVDVLIAFGLNKLRAFLFSRKKD